ncbi:TIGR03086 family metal-binding protein [Kitasatospora sp. RB6PN24]|uniref:TIGR03086 family metal-binding protein n=1 Tax=Kitasatospora humi TaxID=2893891 RepID=UPI001E6169D2|nr:TIGR03086 family metal-binding protein [Kitasatospora humi]MCC9311352.1 TIGR03086 family metal-binding protein [Kitasatospora humi]
MDIRTLHVRALELATEVVDQVTADQLWRPTPCADWRLGELLAHMIGQNHGFAAAARGLGDDLHQWRDRPFPGTPARSWAVSVADVVEAFATAAAPLRLPEVRPGLDIPVETAVSFHHLDTLVHAWDVAVTLGLPFEPPQEQARAVLAVAARVPAGPDDRRPGGSFGGVLAPGAGASEFHRALALLGRDPAWQPVGQPV